MKNIEKLHVAITIANMPQVRNGVFNRNRSILYLKNNLEKFEYEIGIMEGKDSFTKQEAEERYTDAMNDKDELMYDKALYRQECLDHNY